MNDLTPSPDPALRGFCHALGSRHSVADFKKAVAGLRKLKVVVVGEAIFDRYSYVKVQGLTSKNRIISGRFLGEEIQCGGALAVFRHVREFVDQVRFVSLTGQEDWAQAALAQHLSPEQDQVVRDSRFTTIIKQRFVEPLSRGKEMSKLFSVNYIDAAPPAREILAALRQRLVGLMPWADVVLLADFGHGMLQKPLREYLQQNAPFLALNCQTNSNNHGFNILSRQYHRADAFSLDEQELMLACGHRHLDFRAELEKLRRSFGARYAWLTRGPVETIGLQKAQPPALCPPFENDVVDTVGAGDAFFSVAALAAAQGLPVELGTFLGQLAGAQAVKIVGNAKPVSKAVLLQTGAALLASCSA